MEEKKRKAAIEAILFTMGDAVELNRLAEAIGEDPETTLETIRKMMKDGYGYIKEYCPEPTVLLFRRLLSR